MSWEANKDLISVYWLDNQEAAGSGTNNNLKGMYNTIFRTSDGSSFTSEALVFQGGNIAVYPANTAFTQQGDIYLHVPSVQSEQTIDSVPYISNYFVAGEWLDKNVAGYKNGIYAPVKMAANVLTLQLNLANTAKLTEDFGFEIESVSLVSDKPKTFAEKASLKIYGTPYDKGVAVQEGDVKYETIKKSVRVAGIGAKQSLTTTDIVKNAEGKYTVKFVVLPTNDESMTAASEIVIRTNCGILTLQTTDKNGAIASFNKDGEGKILNEKLTGVVYNGNNQYTIAELFKSLVSAYVHNPANPATDKSNFKGEHIGGHYSRSIDGDMANATLDGSLVEDEDKVVHYTNIHDAMGSKAAMNLILVDEDADGIWPISTKSFEAVAKRNTYAGSPVVTMSLQKPATKLQLLGGGNVYFNLDSQWKGVADNSLTVILEAGKAWTMGTGDDFKKIGTFENEGTLTINDANGASLNEKVINNATVVVGSAQVAVGTNLENTADGTITIAAGKDLRFDKDITDGAKLQGTIEVAAGAYLTINQDINVTSKATINNYGTVSSIAGNGGLINEGTINVKDAGAITYVQDNENGVINLLNRNDEVKVEGNKGKIVYNYNSAEDKDGAKFNRETSDKFTYVVFGAGNGNITLDESGIDDISMEFTSSTTLKTNSDVITKLVVAKDAELKLLTPSETYDNVLYVKNLENNGNITIGGKIYYYQSFSPEGVVRSVGSGAIVYYEATATTVEELQAALAAGQNVTLTQNIAIDGDVEIDLKGATLTLGSNKITNSGNLTLKGGTISANVDEAITSNAGSLTMIDCNVTGVSTVVVVYDGNTTITGGSYNNNDVAGSAYCIGICGGKATINTTVNKNNAGNGGLTVQGAEVNITGGEYYGNPSLYQYGLHATLGANVTYSENVKFDNCYIQVRSEAPGNAVLAETTVNDAAFNATTVPTGTGFKGTKEDLNAKIQELLP